MNLINVIVFGVDNIFHVIASLWRSVIKPIIKKNQIRKRFESNQTFFIIVTVGSFREFHVEEMKSLFVSAPQGKPLLQQKSSPRDCLSLYLQSVWLSLSPWLTNITLFIINIYIASLGGINVLLIFIGVQIYLNTDNRFR